MANLKKQKLKPKTKFKKNNNGIMSIKNIWFTAHHIQRGNTIIFSLMSFLKGNYTYAPLYKVYF